MQNLCLLSVCAKLGVQAYYSSKHSCFHFKFVCHSLQSAMVMLQASQLCFAVFLASLPSTQAEGNSFPLFISRHNNNSLASDSGFINNTRCGWHCTIIDSDLPKHLKTVSVKDRLIKVVVEYEEKVTEQCARQASFNSSGNGTEYFNVWLPANYKHFNFDHAVQRVLDLVTSSNAEERVNVKTACTFRPLRTSSTEPAVNAALKSDFLSQSVRSHLADHGFNVKRSNDCNAEMSNLQSCIAMGNSTVNSTDSHLIPIWWDYGLIFLVFVFSLAFVYFSPAHICLFCPTVITERGLCQIVLEGASPVSFRSIVGNYFHSGSDTRHGALMLVLRLVLLPLPLIPPAIVYCKLLQPVLELPYLDFSKPFMIVPLFCYVVQAIYASFFTISRKMKPCLVCGILKSDPNCDSEPRRRILNHLRVQPLILIKCWKFFRNSLVHYCKLSRAVFPLGNMSFRCFFRVVGFLGFISTIPVISVILFAAMLGADLFGIIVTAPLNTLLLEEALVYANSNSLLGNRLPVLVRIFITAFAFAGSIGVILISLCAAFGVGMIIAIVFILLLSEQSLPFLVLFVLVCFYLWSSYSSFTNQYHDFSLKLFKYYQEHQHGQVSKEVATATTADLAQHSECTPNPENAECKAIKIPKQLFKIACEELMPIRESVCVLVLKIILILSFVFLVFGVVMTYHVGATPMMRALATFLTGSLPKIVGTIYVDGPRQRKLKAMMIKERAPIIVQRYLNRTGTYSGEVIIVDTKESIQLVNMETS